MEPTGAKRTMRGQLAKLFVFLPAWGQKRKLLLRYLSAPRVNIGDGNPWAW